MPKKVDYDKWQIAFNNVDDSHQMTNQALGGLKVEAVF